MIKRKSIFAIKIALILATLIFVSSPAHASSENGRLDHWPTPSYPIYLPVDALLGIEDETSAIAAISSAVATLAEGFCEEALALTILFSEHAIRSGSTLDAPANGVFYADMLNISAQIAQSITGGAQGILDNAGVTPARPIATGLNFVSGERGALNISFPHDVSGVAFDNITIETDFASITINREFISGSALRIERGLPIAAGAHMYSQVPGTTNGLVPVLRFLLDYWAVAAFVLIMVVWGVLASKGMKLRLWVVPVVAVILIAANIWTLRPQLEEPGDIVYATAPVYFYSVIVEMPQDMSVVLGIPIGGAYPGMFVLHNEYGELVHSRYNPFSGVVEAYISAGGKFFLREA